MELTEAHLLDRIDRLTKDEVKLDVGWIGPFMAMVGCYRPESIKLVLTKGQRKFIINVLNLNTKSFSLYIYYELWSTLIIL